MQYLMIGLIAFVAISFVAATRDAIGFGLLLSSNVDGVADARLKVPAVGIPPLYVAAVAAAGTGVGLSLPGVPAGVRWLSGALLATFLLGTMWDMRRRRGTLAVYIRLRRAEIGFSPRGDVIEVPKLVFLVMSQPTPLVWMATALALGALGVALLPYESWPAMLPLSALAVGIFWMWLRNRTNPWERLARHLRWVSLVTGENLIHRLEDALDLDPEVMMLRREADAVVMRFMTKDMPKPQ